MTGLTAADYLTACDAAATSQGLDPIRAALTAAGHTVSLEQTGGFCMVLTIVAPDPANLYTINAESIALMVAADWYDCAETPLAYHAPDDSTLTPEAAVTFVTSHNLDRDAAHAAATA